MGWCRDGRIDSELTHSEDGGTRVSSSPAAGLQYGEKMADSFTSDAIRLAVTQSTIAALLDPVTTVRSLASGVGDLSRTKKLKSKLDAVTANFEQLQLDAMARGRLLAPLPVRARSAAQAAAAGRATSR
eukprot:COSAG06_NODE_19268_length_845_cov_808.167560_1_plen_128_part_10